MRIFLLLTIIVFIFLPNVTTGQTSSISGKVTDTNNIPIEFAAVALFKDSVYLSSAISDSDGLYHLDGLYKDKYKISFSYLGFLKYDTMIDIANSIQLNHALINESKSLNEVTIRFRRPTIERKGDRLIFNIENSIFNIGLDALEAISKAPSVRVNNNSISIAGKSKVSIMLDDKLIHMTGDDLSAYLKSIRAEDISKIEVITNPSSKYDAEGNSGLINIVTKKIKKQGFNSNFRLSTYKASFYSYSSGITTNYYKNKLKLLASFGVSQGANLTTGSTNTDYTSQKWENGTIRKNYENWYNSRIGVDYQLTPKTNIEVTYSQRNSLPKHEETNKIAITNSLNKLDSLIVSDALIKETKKLQTTDFHLQHSFDTSGKKMVIDADWLNFSNNNSNYFNNNNYLPNGQKITDSNQNNLSKSNQNITLFTIKNDFSFPNKFLNFSFGGKLSFFSNSSDLGFYQLLNNDYKIILFKSNQFDYKENIQALYISADKEIRNWSFQLGIRVENTHTEGVSKFNNQTYFNNYLKTFPSLSANYVLNDSHSFSLNLNKRIDRPSYALLNPFREYNTLYNYEEGNPFLNPSIINNFEIGYVFNNFLTTSLSYGKEINKFELLTVLNDSSNIQASTYLNYLTGHNIGLSISALINASDWLESSNQFSISYMVSKSSITKTLNQLRGFSPYFSSNNTIVFNKAKTFMGNCELEYQLPFVYDLDKSNGYFMLSIELKAILAKKKLQIAVVLNDIFKTGASNNYTFFDNIKINRQYYNDSRQLKVALSYKIGKEKIKKEERQNSNSEEMNRIKQ